MNKTKKEIPVDILSSFDRLSSAARVHCPNIFEVKNIKDDWLETTYPYLTNFEMLLIKNYAYSTSDSETLAELFTKLILVREGFEHGQTIDEIELYSDIEFGMEESYIIESAVRGLSFRHAKAIADALKNLKSGS